MYQTDIYNTALKRVTQDMQMKRTLKDVEQKMQLSDFDVKGKKGHASGGIAGQLHLNRPGYASGKLVLEGIEWLLKQLRKGKKTYYRGEPLTKNLEEMKKLDELIKTNTIMPKTFRGRWFTDKKDIADIYANPEPGLNIIKKVELTPKEIEFGKKLLKLVSYHAAPVRL